MKTGYQEMTQYRDVTYRELAEIIYNNPDEGVGFTLETCEDFGVFGEPTGWYGAKLVNPFDSSYGVLLLDYYGGYGCSAFPLLNEIEKADSIDPFSQQITPDDIIRHIAKIIMQYTMRMEGYHLSTVCTDWPMDSNEEGKQDNTEDDLLIKACSDCGLPCMNNPKERFKCREVVFQDEDVTICSDCSIDYEVDDQGRVVLREFEDNDEDPDEDPRFNSILRDFGYSETEIDELRELRREIERKTKQAEAAILMQAAMN